MSEQGLLYFYFNLFFFFCFNIGNGKRHTRAVFVGGHGVTGLRTEIAISSWIIFDDGALLWKGKKDVLVFGMTISLQLMRVGEQYRCGISHQYLPSGLITKTNTYLGNYLSTLYVVLGTAFWFNKKN